MNSQVTLFHLMFGEQALAAHASASGDLVRWAGLFEDWLDEHGRSEVKERRRSLKVWGEFLPMLRKPPWEAREGDVRAYLKWLRSQGRTEESVRRSMIELSSFYEYAARLGEAVENPTAQIARPKYKQYEGAKYLDAAQIEALLGAINGQDSALGRRDYALILGQVLSSLRPEELRLLRWGQLELGGETARVRIPAQTRLGRSWIRKLRERVRDDPAAGAGERGEEKAGVQGWIYAALAGQVVEAILDWLRASGRLEVIGGDDYIFTPQMTPHLGATAMQRASAWDGSRAISADTSFYCLRKYAGLAGLDERQVNWHVLRNSAILLRVDAGDSSAEIQEHFGFSTRGSHRLMKTRTLINCLLRHGEKVSWKRIAANEAEPGITPGKEQGGHGFYAAAIPAADLARLEECKPSGVGGEIEGLRVLLYHSLKHALENHNPGEILRVIETYSSATQRMAASLKAQGDLDARAERAGFDWTEITRAILDEAGWTE